MDALDLGHVQRTAGIANQQCARHLEFWHRLPTACGDGARAGCDNFAALEQSLDARVVLELLEGFEGLQARIFVVKANDIADVHPIVVEVIQEAAAIGVRVKRPADAVLDQTRLDASGR